MSTLSRIILAFNLSTRNVSRQFTVFQYQSSNSRGKHTNADLPDPGEYMLEDSLEESINDPQPKFLKKIPGRQSVKKQAQLLNRQYIKNKVIHHKLKLLYEKETSLDLLTWVAKAQIKHLNKIDPVYWTLDMLSKSFPATHDEIIKILKSQRIPVDEKEIYEHDKRVHRNWLKMKQAKQMLIEGGPIDPGFRRMVENSKLESMKNAAGSNALPTPDTKHMLVTQEEIAQTRIPKTRGEFSAILDAYKKEKTFKEEVNSRHIKIEDLNVMGLLEELSVDKNKTPETVRFLGINEDLKKYTNDEEVDEEETYESRFVSSDDRDINTGMRFNKNRRHDERHDTVNNRQKIIEDKNLDDVHDNKARFRQRRQMKKRY